MFFDIPFAIKPPPYRKPPPLQNSAFFGLGGGVFGRITPDNRYTPKQQSDVTHLVELFNYVVFAQIIHTNTAQIIIYIHTQCIYV